MQINTNINKQQDKAPAFGAINTVAMCNVMEEHAPGSVQKFCGSLIQAAGDAFYHEQARAVHLTASRELAIMRQRANTLKHLGLPQNLIDGVKTAIHGLTTGFTKEGRTLAKKYKLDIKPPTQELKPIRVWIGRDYLGEPESDMWHNMSAMDTTKVSLGAALHDKMISIFGDGIRAQGNHIKPEEKVFITKHAGSGQRWDHTGQRYGGAYIRTTPTDVIRGWGHPLEEAKNYRNSETINTPEHVALCETVDRLNNFQRGVLSTANNVADNIQKIRKNFEQTIVNRKKQIEKEKLAKQVTSAIDDAFKA